MNAAENGTGTIACPRCQTANTGVSRFCLTCGSPLQPGVQPPSAPPPMPPQPPPMPHYPPAPPMPPIAPSFSPSGFMSATATGGASQVTLNMDVASAFNAAFQAIQLNGGTVLAHQAPSLIRFQTGKRSFWGSLMMRMRFDGELTLSPMGARQTAARVTLKLNSSSSTMLLAMDAIALGVLLLGAIMAKNFMLFAFIGAIAGVQYWIISSRWSSDLAQAIGNSLMSGQSQPSFAAPPAMAGPSNLQPSVAPPIPVSSSARVPPPLPADAASRSASQSSSGQSIAAATAAPLPNVLEQLKQLGALRDAGVVTAEEFENKKADLLKRL